MSEILAFIKTHRRDIIITAAALAASLVVMLLIPAMIVGNAPSTAGMLACIALFFAVDPAFCLAAAIFAGWDFRRRWFTALFPALMLVYYAVIPAVTQFGWYVGFNDKFNKENIMYK